MTTKKYDTLIIGSGPAGEGAAMRLVKSGQRVAVIEMYNQVGGGCTHSGTIPSKALRHSIQTLLDYRKNPLFQQISEQLEVDYPQLLDAAKKVIQAQVSTRYRHYWRNQVDIIQGTARFTDNHTVEVLIDGVVVNKLTASNFVIATGSRPYNPDSIDFSHPRIVDSDSVLDLAHTPKAITIYGAGVIGCEYASIFCNLDVKINLINTRDRLLSFLDDEITDALSYHLRQQGVVIRHNEQYDKVVADESGVTIYCESGKQIKSDVLLWANGRSGNAKDLGLASLDIVVNHREQIEVNEHYQTSQKHIYAIGDVVGAPGLASASYDQGRFVGNLIADGESDWQLIKSFPTGIYTNPEISSVGKTEASLTEEKIPYEVGQAAFENIARAQITGQTVGILKILFHRETLEILGIHCFGESAAEIIHIGQAILHQKGEANTLKYFAETTFNYPTMAEAYRVAALNGLNRL
ncbi:MAG: Si-specific NAD(P)(+) transhydrogenase [Thiotrichaceae bacterium]